VVGPSTLQAHALRERAEIHIARGELDSARQDLDAVRELRGFVPNSIDDAEDLRVVALLRAAEGDIAAAERALREVLQRAEMHRRPELHARATRDLAVVRQSQSTRPQGQIDPVAPRCTSGSQAQIAPQQTSRLSTAVERFLLLREIEGSPLVTADSE